MAALDRRQWPRTELDIQVAKAALFPAQVLRRSLIAEGRETEVEDIMRFVSTLAPDSAASPAPLSDLSPPQSDPKKGSK